MKPMVALVIRLFLTLGLLWIVWHHAHWSVALSITLMFIFAEIVGWILGRKR